MKKKKSHKIMSDYEKSVFIGILRLSFLQESHWYKGFTISCRIAFVFLNQCSLLN